MPGSVRQLESSGQGSGSSKLQIEDILSIEVDSSYYERDDEIIGVQDYNLTRLTRHSMDVQIKFKHPKRLA